MLRSHQDLIKLLVGAVNTRPFCIQIPIVGCQWACSDYLITERDDTVQVAILIILRSPRGTTLRLTIEQSLCQEVSSGVLGPCTVTAPLILGQHVIGILKVFND